MSLGLRRRSLRAIVALGALAGAVLAAPSATVAGPIVPYLDVTFQDPCLSAFDLTPGADVTLTLKRAGAVAAKRTVRATDETIRTCLASAIRGGDRLTIKQVKDGDTLTDRTLQLPVLTVTLHAGTDTLSVHGELGGAPMDGAAVLLSVDRSIAGRFIEYQAYNGSLDAAGTVNADWSGLFDIQPGFDGWALWSSPSGDSVRAVTALPSLAVRAGSSAVNGVARTGTKTTVTLKRAGGTVRGKMTAVGRLERGEPVFTGTLRNGTTKVTPAAGNRVTSSRLTGSWKVLANTLAVTPGAGTGSLTLTCPSDVQVVVWADGTSIWLAESADGAIAINNLPLPSGSKVEVACQDAAGYAQVFTRVAP